MARSWKALRRNTMKVAESSGFYVRYAVYYGFIPALLYLGFTTDPKPNLGAMLGALRE
jgi:hypothetical protein